MSVFGPGFGEAIAVHLGAGAWMLIDSCLDPETRTPATLNYLNSIGVSGDNVKAILASHWHDDHVRGIAELARSYPDAEFHLSSTFNHKEAVAVLAAHSGQTTSSLSHGTKELFTVLDERDNVHFAHQRSTILELVIACQTVRVTALSPAPAAFARSVASLAQFLPGTNGGEPINNVVPLKPNVEAVAVHVDIGDDAILLGSDLEDDASHGWSAVVADSWVACRRKSSALKVAHHGSLTGDSPHIWATLLETAPVAALTPYNRGGKLPTADDVARLKSRTSNAWISSSATRKPQIPVAQLQRLGDVAKNIVPVNNGFGCVRLRRRKGEAWRAECFGDARAL